MKPGQRTIFAKHIPRHGQAHRIVATSCHLLKVKLCNKALFMVMHELGIRLTTQFVCQSNRIKG